MIAGIIVGAVGVALQAAALLCALVCGEKSCAAKVAKARGLAAEAHRRTTSCGSWGLLALGFYALGLALLLVAQR